MQLAWRRERLDWVNIIYMAVVHAVALTAPWHFTWRGLWVLLGLYWLSGSVGICLGYHRLLTHRAFRVPRALEYFFTFCGLLASEGGAIKWVAIHRRHHEASDRAGADPHTPRDGFFWSHMGWVLHQFGADRATLESRYAPELARDPVHRVLDRLHVAPNVLVGVGLYFWGGWSLVVWGVFLRVVLGLHATWFVNSAAHTWGYRTYATPEGSTNLWWVGLIAWGEGWHNNHHAFPRSARHGLRWWELDATWILIRALRGLGLAHDVRLLPVGAERFLIHAPGQTSEALPATAGRAA